MPDLKPMSDEMLEWSRGYIGRRRFDVDKDCASELLAEVYRLRKRQSKLEAVLEVVQSEHYQVGAPGVPRERGGCICDADDCPELEALAALGEPSHAH